MSGNIIEKQFCSPSFSGTSNIDSGRLASHLDKLIRSLQQAGYIIDSSCFHLSDSQIARHVDECVIADARRKGYELVRNPLHPENRMPPIHGQNQGDPLATLNEGIKNIGAFFRQYCSGQYDPTPD